MKLSRTLLEPLLFIALAVCIGLLLKTASELSFSYKDAVLILGESKNFLFYIVNFWIELFGLHSFSVRVLNIIFYSLSVLLLYLLTANYFTKEVDRFISTIIFALLPGLNSAALIINESMIIIFCILLYLYLYKLTKKHNLYLLFLFLFIDNSFAIFYLSLFFYAIYKKDNLMVIVTLLLFGLSMSLFGFDTGGKPKGHFVNTLAIYASIFSPLLFFYFAYAMYKISFKGTKSIYWFVSVTAFGFSLLFAFRQKIDIANFAPYVVIAIPMMVKLFMHSYRVRLRQFRTYHKLGANLVLIVLIVNFLLLHFNKPLYIILENPQKHFAHDYHFAMDVAKKLKNLGINGVYCEDDKLQIILRLYGVSQGNEYYLSNKIPPLYEHIIDVNVYDRNIYRVFVTKLNI